MKRLVYLSVLFCLLAANCLQMSAQKQKTRDSVAVHLSDTLHLDEVTVTAPIRSMEQKGDTVIFNANAFKVPEDAYLEALVRRIPGLNYDPKTHSMSFNGYPIREITVNGKEFFKGNSRIALENIPASFVSRLKVYDKETEKEKATGIKDTDKNYVLDLQTPKRLNGTLNASAEAGYGSQKKKEINGQVFRFEEGGDNFSIVGRTGNRNFTTPDKRNIVHTVGTSISRHLNEKLELSGGVNYSYNRNGTTGAGYSENYLTEATQYGANTQSSLNKNQNVGGNLNLRWEIDSMTSVMLGGNARYLPSTSESNIHSAIFTDNPELDLKNPFAHIGNVNKEKRVNEHLRHTLDEQSSWRYDINMLFSRKLNSRGDNLTLNYLTSRNNSKNKSLNVAEATYFRLKDVWGNDSVSRQNQYQESPDNAQSHEIELAYTHPVGKKSHLQLAYAFRHEQERNRQDTYDFSPFQTDNLAFNNLPPHYESERIDSLSNRNESTTEGHKITLTYNYQGKIWGIQAKLAIAPQRRTLTQTDTGTHIDTASSHTEWYPAVVITRQKNNWYTMLSYYGHTLQPSLTSLLAPTKYISPLYVSRSNPDLKSSYRHSAYFTVNNFTKGVNASVIFSQEFNSVTQATTYDPETGKRETRPVNINGNWNLNGYAGYNKSIGLFRLFADASGDYAHHLSLIDDGGTGEMEQSLTRALGLSAAIRTSFVPTWGNIDLNGKWDYQQSKNSLQGNSTYTRYYMAGLNAQISLPLNLSFNTEANYHIRNGTGIQGDNNNEIIWNIRLAWKFLEEKRAELAFIWNDILNQKKSYYRYASATRFSEIYSEQLRGYFMVSLKYQFNRMN